MESVKKRLLFLILCLSPWWANASHIVGGEFELIHLSGDTYRLNLVLYFDELNGNPQALDQPGITARIYRLGDNVFVRNVYLALIKDTHVNYTQPECSNG